MIWSVRAFAAMGVLASAAVGAQPRDMAEAVGYANEWMEVRFLKKSGDETKAAEFEALLAKLRDANDGTVFCSPRRMSLRMFGSVLVFSGLDGKRPLANPAQPAAEGMLELAKKTFSCTPPPFDPNDFEGDGLTVATAITRKSSPGGIGSTYAWLRHHYPGFKLQMQALVASGDERRYDLMTITTADGESKALYFRLSDWPAGMVPGRPRKPSPEP